MPYRIEVTVAGLATTPGETIHVPDSGYDIGGGNDVMVLYADETRLTLKYTREDDIVQGYTLYRVTIVAVGALGVPNWSAPLLRRVGLRR